MLRRTTKITALLATITSTMTITPVMATEKLNQRDATVNEAVAYDNGKYIYYGYRDDDDDTAIYYNNGSSKDKEMNDDLEDYEINYLEGNQVKYGSKYVYVTEPGNNDEYMIDLSNGKIDDDSPESKQDEAQSDFISKVKKTERYNKYSDSSHKIDSSNIASNRLFRNQFGDVWYQYVANTTSSSVGDAENLIDKDGQRGVTTGSAVTSFGGEDNTAFTGFYDEKGKYIDTSYLANMKIYNSRKNKATLIEKYGKVYQDEAIKVDLIGIKPIGQDKNYIYTFTKVRVTYYNYDSAEERYIFNEKDEKYNPIKVEQYFVQKISKKQGNKEDEAYIPDSVESFQVDPSGYVFEGDGSKSDSDERDDAYKLLSGTISRYDSRDNQSDIIYAIKDGDIYTTVLEDSDTVHTYKIKLSNDKVDVNGSDLSRKLNFGTNNYTNRTDINNDGEDIDTKIAYRSEDDDHDYEIPEYENKNTNNNLGGVSVDSDGNTWIINKGKVLMYDGKEFKEKYSTDRSYDRLDVYDKDSLIAWSQDTDSYTTVKEGKQQTIDDAKEIDPSLTNQKIKTGWEKQSNGTWMLYDASGNKVTGWAFMGNKWYYMDADGIMKTGWVLDRDTWYYCDSSGAMVTGWLADGYTWYYLQSNGAMKTGWFNDNGTWYYLKATGAMAANEYIDGYYVNGSGAWVE